MHGYARKGLMKLSQSLDGEYTTPRLPLCVYCEDEIPARRSCAVPDARICASCLEFYGDTIHQRFDGSEFSTDYRGAVDEYVYRDTVALIGGCHLPGVFEDEDEDDNRIQREAA